MCIRNATGTAALLTVVFAAPLAAQPAEQQMLRRHFDRNLDKVAEEARRALPGILLYPQDVMNAVLVVSQEPGLTVRVYDAGTDPGGALDEILADYPDDIAAAAKLLSGYPQVLEVLQENLVATSVIGRVYAGDPSFTMRTVNSLAVKARAEHDASVDAWADLLRDDPEALGQFQEAADAYAEELGYEEEEPQETAGTTVIIVDDSYDSWDDDCWYWTYGWYWRDRLFVIGDLPRHDFVEWLLHRHCDRYPGFADRVIHHVRHRRARGPGRDFPGEMGYAYDRWREHNPMTTMGGFLNDDGNRVERLHEFGVARNEMERSGTPAESLQQHIARHPDRYPAINRGAGPDRTPGGPERRAGWPGRTVEGRHTAPGVPQAHRPEVKRVVPSQYQQMQRATTRHRSSWRGPSSHRVYYGGRRRGGGRRR